MSKMGKKKQHGKRQRKDKSLLQKQQQQNQPSRHVAAMMGSNPKRIGEYRDRHRILCVGEGDFSFAMSLCNAIGGKNVVATSYDSHREVRSKYDTGVFHLANLQSMGATVAFEVDARELHFTTLLKGKVFDRIVFNFPHVGGASDEDVACNKEMLQGFFLSARVLLEPDGGQIHVTLRDTSFYTNWGVPSLAQKAGMELLKTIPFDNDDYPGYKPVRTNPAVRAAPDAQKANTMMFKIDPGAPVPPVPAKLNKQTDNSIDIDANSESGTTEDLPAGKSTTKRKADEDQDVKPLYCPACEHQSENAEAFKNHKKTPWHRRKEAKLSKKKKKSG